MTFHITSLVSVVWMFCLYFLLHLKKLLLNCRIFVIYLPGFGISVSGLLHFLSLCRIDIIFSLKCFIEFNSGVILTWSFLWGEIFDNEVNFISRYMATKIFNLLTHYIFQGIYPFYLSCQICWHKVGNNIILLPF